MADDLHWNINISRVEILKNLDLGIIITEELRSKGIISQEQAEILLDETVPHRRNSRFIRYLERKSPSQIKGFCEILQNHGQEHVSQLITDSVATKCPSRNDKTLNEVTKPCVNTNVWEQFNNLVQQMLDNRDKWGRIITVVKNKEQTFFRNVAGTSRANSKDVDFDAYFSESHAYSMSNLDLIILAGLVAAEVITEEQAAKIAENKKLDLLQCSFAHLSEKEINSFLQKLQKTLQLHDTEKQEVYPKKSPESDMVEQQDSRRSADTLDDIKNHNSMKLAREIVKDDIIQKDVTNADPSENSLSPLMKDIDLNTLCSTVLCRAKRVVMHGPRDGESVLSALAAEWASITEDIIVLDNPLQQETEAGEYLKKFDLTVTLDIANNHNKGLSDVILEEHPRMRNVENIMSLIEKNQSKVLFLIKGYDKSRLDRNSDMQKLLNREILPEATCIVSTTDQFPGYKTSWSDKEVLVEEYLHKHTIPDEEILQGWMKPKKSSTEYIQNCCIEDIQESHKNRVSSFKQGQQTMKLYDVCFSGTPSRVLTVDPVRAPAQGLFIDTIAVDWALYWQFMKQGKSVQNILDKAVEHLLNYDICVTLDLHDVTSDQTLVEIIKAQHQKLEELEDLEEFLEENQDKTLFLVKGLNSYITKGMFNSDINKLFEKLLLPDVVCVLAYRGQVRRSAFHWGRCVQLTEAQVDVCRSNGKGRKRRSVGSVFSAVEMDAKKLRN